jgi:hypothetical protein
MLECCPVISSVVGLLLSPIAIVLLLAGCSSKTSASRTSPGSAPTIASVVPQPSAPSSSAIAAPNDAGILERDGPFRVECASRLPDTGAVVEPLLGASTEEGPRACVLRGRVRAVHHAAISRASSGLAQREPLSALAIEIDADESIPCRTPLDPGEKALREPNGTARDAERAKVALIVGGARIESALRPGNGLCGWSRRGIALSLGEPKGWEGQLTDAAGALLGAWSSYFEASESKSLARSWQFERGGPVERLRIDEGGAFLRHRDVLIRRDAASAISTQGNEVILHASDGSFAVSAVSRLTTGPIPSFVLRQNGYGFYAVRIDLPSR